QRTTGLRRFEMRSFYGRGWVEDVDEHTAVGLVQFHPGGDPELGDQTCQRLAEAGTRHRLRAVALAVERDHQIVTVCFGDDHRENCRDRLRGRCCFFRYRGA